jgi:hypothetical protein
MTSDYLRRAELFAAGGVHDVVQPVEEPAFAATEPGPAKAMPSTAAALPSLAPDPNDERWVPYWTAVMEGREQATHFGRDQVWRWRPDGSEPVCQSCHPFPA